MTQDSKSTTLAKNTVLLYVRMFLVMAVSLYTSRVVLRILGFDDFGIYNVVGSVVVFMSFLQAALRNATFRYIAYDLGCGDTDRLKYTYSMAINSHFILSVVLFVLIGGVGEWFVLNKLNIPEGRVQAASWTFLFSLITFCISIVRTPYESNILAHEKMDFYALTSICEVLLKLGVVFILMKVTFDKLIAYSILVAISMIVIFIWYVIYCHKKFEDCRYVCCWEPSIIRQFVTYSGWSLLVNGATITRSQCINIFFNLFLGVLANTAMGIANQVVSALNTFVTNFTQAFRPQLIKSWAEKDTEYFMRLVFASSKISYFLLLLVTIPIVSNVDFILGVWLGEYPDIASVYIEAILLYYLIDALQEPLVVSVHATGKLKYHQIMIASIVLVVIPTAYIMLKLGFSGTSILIINAFANLICAVARTVYMKRLISLDIRSYLNEVVLPLFLVTIISAPWPLLISSRMPSNWLNVIGISIVSIFVSIVSFWFVGLNRRERAMFHAMPTIRKIFGH